MKPGDITKHALKRKEAQKAALKKEPFARPLNGKTLTDVEYREKLESLVIALYDAVVDTEGNFACNHERWAYFKTEHEFELSHLGAAAVSAMVRRDKGKCQFCGGDARVCYERHAEGRSCA
jgi:hypothetical protein